MLVMYLYIVDADSVLFHRTSSVGPCLPDPGLKGLAFSSYIPSIVHAVYHFTINSFNNQTYFATVSQTKDLGKYFSACFDS